MFKELRTIILLLFFMLILAVVISIAGCSRTVEKSVVTHDTTLVSRYSTDTLKTHQSVSDTLFKARSDTFRTNKADTVYKTIVRSDSILRRDSVYIQEKGDSVIIYKEHWNTKVMQLHDTIYRSRNDTVERIRTDTLYKVRTDTLVVYQSSISNDSTYKSSDKNKAVVKERRSWGWLKWLGIIAPIIVVLSVIWKARSRKPP